MKTYTNRIQITNFRSSLITPRQPEGVCRKGTFY